MKATVIRKSHFNAAHRLHVKEWSEEKNQSFFGLCNNVNYHGHNYVLEVAVRGEIDKVTGFVYDLGKLKQVIEEEIIQPFDHKNLNLDTSEFRNLNPTAENIAMVVWGKLRKRIESEFELSVRLYETERNIIEFNGA